MTTRRGGSAEGLVVENEVLDIAHAMSMRLSTFVGAPWPQRTDLA
jgi:hypothetical protein